MIHAALLDVQFTESGQFLGHMSGEDSMGVVNQTKTFLRNIVLHILYKMLMNKKTSEETNTKCNVL